MVTVELKISVTLDPDIYEEKVACGWSENDIIAEVEDEIMAGQYKIVLDTTFSDEKLIGAEK